MRFGTSLNFQLGYLSEVPMNAALEHALQDWYPVAMVGELAPGELKHSKLLGVDITVLANHVDSATESTPTITVRADRRRSVCPSQ